MVKIIWFILFGPQRRNSGSILTNCTIFIKKKKKLYFRFCMLIKTTFDSERDVNSNSRILPLN